MYLNTRIFPTTGYARVLLFMFIRRELGGTGTGCLFQFTYCVAVESSKIHNGFDTAGFRFLTRQSSLSNTCSIGPKSGNKLSRGRLAMFC